MTTIPSFISLISTHGSNVLFHREDSDTLCPCVTPEGARDPEWHAAHPSEPVCNEAGRLPGSGEIIDLVIKGFVQPIQSTRATRLSTEMLQRMFGEVQADDHLGIFPVEWAGRNLNFRNWSQRGEDFIRYPSSGIYAQNFMVVNSNLIPDPSDGNAAHHWECGLRLIA